MKTAAFSFMLLLVLALALPAPASAAAGQGLELLRQGRFQEAIAPLRQARTIAPGDPSLKQALALSYLGAGIELGGKGRVPEGIVMLRAGKELQPDDGRFSLHLGHLLFRQGETGEAEAYLLEAVQQLGPTAEAFRLLAQLCYAGDRLYEAQSHLEQAIALGPATAGDREFLARIQRELRVEETMDSRHGGNFSITYVDGGELLGVQTLEVLQEAFAELGTLFNTFPPQPVAVILYGREDFSTVTGAPDWAGGGYDGKIRVPVGGLREMTDDLRRVLYHEYAHALIFTMTRGNLPRWLNEGLAQVAEGEWPARHRALLEHAREVVGPLAFSRLENSFGSLSAGEAGSAYLQSRDFVRYLLDRYGWPRMLDLLQALGSREKFEAAAARLLLYPGEDLGTLQREWLAEQG